MSSKHAQAAISAASISADTSADTAASATNTTQRIALLPGATVDLPFTADGLLARLGDNGNLAIRAGDETIILLGYTQISQQAPVTIRSNDGIEIDLADILAATDPNLDIETAAGPATAPAAGDQGSGIDNNGALFTRFDPNGGLGGLASIGGLASSDAPETGIDTARALQRNFDEAEVAEIAAATPREPLPIEVPGHGDDRADAPVVPLWDLFGIDTIIGTRFNDDARGFAGNDNIWGRGGDDHLYGGDGKDTLRGGDDNDHIDGGSGRDSLHGDAGDDYLIGGAGADRFDGGSGDDVIADVDAADLAGGSINGGDGDDVVIIGRLAAFDVGLGHADNITNIEVLNMTGDANPAVVGEQGTLLTLDPDAVLDMTDADNALFVQGDAEDAVTLTGSWTKGADTFIGDDGMAYDQYVGQTSGGATVTLYVDQGISTQI